MWPSQNMLTLYRSKISFRLKVALSQKMLEDFYFSKINIPMHYPEQKISISCLLFLAGNLNFLLRDIDLEYKFWQWKNSPVSSDLKPPLKKCQIFTFNLCFEIFQQKTCPDKKHGFHKKYDFYYWYFSCKESFGTLHF